VKKHINLFFEIAKNQKDYNEFYLLPMEKAWEIPGNLRASLARIPFPGRESSAVTYCAGPGKGSVSSDTSLTTLYMDG
jgi:hypothetical protein